MNIVTIICVVIGLVCLYYDAKMLIASDNGSEKVIQKIVQSEQNDQSKE